MRTSTSFLCSSSEVSSLLVLYLNGMHLQNNEIIQTIHKYINAKVVDNKFNNSELQGTPNIQGIK